eukprot:TRINITY_DN3132_c0_g2_i2.p3 TRINITY_DN3132_c0_g2~~TRINITY_DN3132_c0_g2_i2.p3  ORF type:complete len:122 (-),score=21.38 TRINITY_DN3132_c0_g2_i2:109-474(-)
MMRNEVVVTTLPFSSQFVLSFEALTFLCWILCMPSAFAKIFLFGEDLEISFCSLKVPSASLCVVYCNFWYTPESSLCYQTCIASGMKRSCLCNVVEIACCKAKPHLCDFACNVLKPPLLVF